MIAPALTAALKWSRWLPVLLAASHLHAQTKTIHLRNQPITTTPGQATLQGLAPASPVSGLWLVQFEAAPDQARREQLQSLGVQLLRYVPEDAFVARFNKVQLSQVKALPFVRWIGEYKPEYKIHSALAQGTNRIQARILLAGNAQPKEMAPLLPLLRGGRAQRGSRFGRIWEVTGTPAELQAAAKSSVVLWLEPAARPKLYDEIATKIVGGDNQEPGTGSIVQQLGFDGSGVTVSVADSGLDVGEADGIHPDLEGRVDRFLFYGRLTDASDEHSHGTHVSGIVAGNAATGETDENGYLYGLGVAPNAHLVAQRIFDGEGNYEPPPSNETLTRDAVRAGAQIGSNSWGDDTQGRYDLSAHDFDALVRDADELALGDQPYVLEFSAGNAGPGPQTIGSPAVAKNVIATGACQNDRFDFFLWADGAEFMADFSSRGPCEDGRIKPDIVAPGTWIASLQSSFATDENSWSPISFYYQYQGGTSQSGPHASGAAAVFIQYYRETHTNATPSPALVKAALINSATDMDDTLETDPVPNTDEGWGRVNLPALMDGTRVFDFHDQTTLLRTGQSYEQRVVVGSSDEPLKITLVYTDVPGFPAAIPALVNDLDLEVTAPDGQVYRGNQFEDGESVPGSPARDDRNNVEAVHISVPLPGEYIIRVEARAVPEDARRDTPEPDQDFALITSGDLPGPGVGTLILDRPAYRAPGVIAVKLIDFDLKGQASVPILLTSSTETNGETVVLQSFGPNGVFTGSIATVTGPALTDSQLQIASGDEIQARYVDLSPSETRIARARADFTAPVISQVTTNGRLARVTISWETDEPAVGIVRYGTNIPPTLAVSNSLFRTSHEITLNNLVEGVTYRFEIVSIDAAGNAATNNNLGNYFTFVPPPAATVLLVNDYQPDEFTEEVPVSTYTIALDRTGFTYDVWDTIDLGVPGTNDLHPYRVVIWRVSDSIGSQTTISAAAQANIRTYVNGGGGFLFTSMESLTRLGAVAFRTNVLHVESFDEDPGVPGVEGVDNDPITAGMNLELDYSAYHTDFHEILGISEDLSDTIKPIGDAEPIFFANDSGGIAGLRYPRTGQDATGRVVFLSFPLDTIPLDTPAPDNRSAVLQNIIKFLAPGASGLGSIAFDRPAYTIPSLMTIEVADSDLAGQAQIPIQVFSSSETNGITVLLSETVQRGTFRGSVSLVATNPPAGSSSLKVKNGDSVWAEYPDLSPPSTRRATSQIDTDLPAISGISSEAEYQEAIIRWETTEPTDGLVQFGESTFLGRTSYDGLFSDGHELLLRGLLPDRIYFYQVVSRDRAGNTITDDNHGEFYTFHTLAPRTLPFFDDLDHASSTNWAVIRGDESETEWELGVPANDRETAANSPPNSWGSNLQGLAISIADTLLVGPALNLTGGNSATLRFWHSYDFTERGEFDLYEFGQVYISTNNTADWTLVAEFADESAGWEEAEVDLTPYLGQVVSVGWYYGLLAFDAPPRPGWLIDDISVTVTNIAGGTVEITNNISTASFALVGPAARSGRGNYLVVSNAPPGTYSVTFGDVPFYETPLPQTNVLSSSNLIRFTGTYTFRDANANNVSDAWETNFFAGLLPVDPRLSDSDGDGATDYQEFVAGTNPTNAQSTLSISPPAPLSNGNVRYSWASVPGHSYRLEISTDLINWLPFSDWVTAVSATTSLTLPAPTNQRFYWLRLATRL